MKSGIVTAINVSHDGEHKIVFAAEKISETKARSIRRSAAESGDIKAVVSAVCVAAVKTNPEADKPGVKVVVDPIITDVASRPYNVNARSFGLKVGDYFITSYHDGKYSMALFPVVHASLDIGKRELARLAVNTPGMTFMLMRSTSVHIVKPEKKVPQLIWG